MTDTTTEPDTTTVVVTIPAHSGVLNETMTLNIPAYFEPTLADIVADERTVYGPRWNRGIVETLADISRHQRHGNRLGADMAISVVILRHWQAMQDEARASRP